MTVYKLQKHVRLVSTCPPPWAGGVPAWGNYTVASRPVLAQSVVLWLREVLIAVCVSDGSLPHGRAGSPVPASIIDSKLEVLRDP